MMMMMMINSNYREEKKITANKTRILKRILSLLLKIYKNYHFCYKIT